MAVMMLLTVIFMMVMICTSITRIRTIYAPTTVIPVFSSMASRPPSRPPVVPAMPPLNSAGTTFHSHTRASP